MYIPLLGRLSVYEYLILCTSFTLAWLEYIISVITHLLPGPVIKLFTFSVTKIYNWFNLTIVNQKEQKKYHYFNRNEQTEIDNTTYQLMRRIMHCKNINEMANVFGYMIEDHLVHTKDDYLLTVHRIKKEGVEPPRNGRVVYLHHGLLMCSEIWLTKVDKQNLPIILYEKGYDVWMGNNRGNKYCQKHLFRSTKTEEFWNFSIDEFALFDIPNVIDYILHATKQEKLTYIGFSQGTAQAFASVSINEDLNHKLDRIVAISPATTPHGLYSKFLDIFIKASPNIMYLLFSRKILMPSVLFWQKIMYPPLFNTSIDISNNLLFNWKSKNINKIQKLCSYSHLYSTTSVKTVVHWFQIISKKNFQMYSEDGEYPISYPLKNIKVPIDLIYGNCDSLVDIKVMLNQLPSHSTTCYEVDGHEHLDNIWGNDIYAKVFRHVIHCIDPPKQNGSI